MSFFKGLRHPVKTFRARMRTCSVRRAFIAYAVIGVASSLAVSFLLAYVFSLVVSNVYYNGRQIDSGLYVYDEAKDALVPADSIDWLVAAPDPRDEDAGLPAGDPDGSAASDGAEAEEPSAGIPVELSVFVSSYAQGSRFATEIPLDGSVSGSKDLVVEDVVAASAVSGPDARRALTLTLSEIPAYDAARNAERGDVDAIEDALPAAADGTKPVVSLVGYYVKGESPVLYTTINLIGLLLIPVCCVICFLLASRAFYRNVLHDPLRVLDDAAGRIASGDLDFTVPVPSAGTKNELDGLCSSFEVMRGELERVNRSMWRAAENRRRVNAAFAHDLRTPLTVLKGRAELLSAAAASGTLDAGSVAEAAGAMGRQVARLERYAESMRDLSALDDYRVDARAVDLGEWFERLAADTRDYVEGAGLVFASSFEGDRPEAVSIDEGALARIVENAASNAVRYASTQVLLRCSWEDDVLITAVEDDGAGFDAEAMERGCEAFWRGGGSGADLRSDASDSCHFGLGLNIAASLCEKHGGALRLGAASIGGALVEAHVSAPAVSGEA